MRQIKTLIIGAGISGLTYANFCKEDLLIIEKEPVPGGLCKSFYADAGRYVWDCAGHFFHFSDKRIKHFFEKKIREEDLVFCKKNTKIYYNNNLIDYPFQSNIHQLPKEELIDCLYDLFNKDEENGGGEEYKSFCEMLYGKFGRSITEKFLRPYNEKLYACDLNILDTDAMGRFFPYVSPIDIIKNFKKKNTITYNEYFEYPKKGAVTFINALKEGIEDKKIILNCALKELDIKKHLAFAGEEVIRYDKLISSIPLNNFLSLKGMEKFSNILPELHSNTVLVFNMGFNKKSAIDNIHWIYFPDKSINFYRVGFYDNILGTDKLSIYVEIGFERMDKIDIPLQLDKTMDGLRKCGIITDHKLISYNTVLIPNAYVHITSKSKKLVEEIEKKMELEDIYIMGRYGSWRYCSIEDCMLQAIELSKRL